jgi:CMP/dCMP kinase
MIITLAWHHGAGKSTLSRGLVARYGLTSYSVGGMMRELAMERGESLLDLGREAERDGGAIDRALDARTRMLGETEDNFVIDGRLAFHYIPHAFKIFLTVPPEEAAKRIYHDASRAGVESHVDMIDTINNIRIRRVNEDTRYMEYYGIHIYDMSHYDLVIDTANRAIEEVLEEAIEAIERQRSRAWKK